VTKKLKILAIHNIGFDEKDKESGVHIWRIWRPLEELKKHVDWQIDYQKSFIKDIEKFKDLSEFTEDEVEAAGRHLGSYDVVYCSYHADWAAHCLMMAVANRYGTKFILDDDDNTFAIEPENPFWVHMGHDKAFYMQRILRTSRYLSTTTDNLAEVFRKRNEENAKIYVLPNYISESYQQTEPDNGDKLVIGYFGGTNHYIDFEQTGVVEALARIMHEHKNVHFRSIGVPIQKYLPKARYHLEDTVFGRKFVTELYPTMKFDIGLAPIRQTIFSDGKSNIKWQEYTRMGAAFIGSDVGPYKSIKPGAGLLVQNTEDDWYKGLKALVLDAEKRKQLVKTARTELKANWRLEDPKNWGKYKAMIEEVAND
jgi:hypothetical protein